MFSSHYESLRWVILIGARASKRGGYSARCALIAYVNVLNHERARMRAVQ